ncbi:MAG: alpha/beta hydrolase [Limnochordaceae bacterium]|nr:alpha/beta hydrolase [Limnochordaceae bacterium]
MYEKTGHFTGQDGLRLFYRSWTAAEAETAVPVVVVHGAFEHGGRYRHVGQWLSERGYDVFVPDLRGHGLSEGRRMWVERFSEYLTDLDRFLDQLARPDERVLLVGHSMGGLIALHYALSRPRRLSALVLSAPWIRLRLRLNPLERALAPVMASILPRLERPSGIDPGALSRDPAVGRAYEADPLVTKRATVRWFVECSRAAAAIESAGTVPLEMPVMVLQGAADPIVDPATCRSVFERIEQPRKVLKWYPGVYHEIFNDPDHEQVLQDVVEWAASETMAAPGEQSPAR